MVEAAGTTSFTFPQALSDLSEYEVKIQRHPDGQSCEVSDAKGTLDGADVSNVKVTCADLTTIRVIAQAPTNMNGAAVRAYLIRTGSGSHLAGYIAGGGDDDPTASSTSFHFELVGTPEVDTNSSTPVPGSPSEVTYPPITGGSYTLYVLLSKETSSASGGPAFKAGTARAAYTTVVVPSNSPKEVQVDLNPNDFGATVNGTVLLRALTTLVSLNKGGEIICAWSPSTAGAPLPPFEAATAPVLGKSVYQCNSTDGCGFPALFSVPTVEHTPLPANATLDVTCWGDADADGADSGAFGSGDHYGRKDNVPTGASTFGDMVTIEKGGLTVSAGGMDITGDAQLHDGLMVDGMGHFYQDVSVDGDIVTMGTLAMRPRQAAASFAGYAALEVGLDDAGSDVLVLGPRAPANGAYNQISSVQVEGPISVNNGLTATSTAVFQQEARYEGPVIFTGEVDFRDATALRGLEIGGNGTGVVLGNWSFQGDNINHDGVGMLQGQPASGNAGPQLNVLVDMRAGGQLIANHGLSVLATQPGAQAIFSVPTTFAQNTIHSGTLRMKFPSGAESELLKPRTNGALHIDDNRQLTELVIESSTRFTSNTNVLFEGTTVAQGNMAVQGKIDVKGGLYVGSGWRFAAGEGIEGKRGGAWGSVLSTSGTNSVVLDADAAYPGGTRTGGAFESAGKVTANGGMTVRAAGANRFTVDSSLSRFLNKVKVESDLEVDTAGAGGLKVDANGVTMSGTLANVSGSLLVNGSAGFNKGIGGSGTLKTKIGACQNVSGACPNGTWSTGVVQASSSCGFFWTGCSITFVNRCCVVELSN